MKVAKEMKEEIIEKLLVIIIMLLDKKETQICSYSVSSNKTCRHYPLGVTLMFIENYIVFFIILNYYYNGDD